MPTALVENARRAEAAGFDFVSISDHLHPCLEARGHSPFAGSVLGAIAHVTSTIAITAGLTCPIIRYHPAIIAQAAATIAPDRVWTPPLQRARLANERADGIVATEPRADLAEAFRAGPNGAGPRYCEVALAYAETEAAGLALAHERFKFSAFGWSVMSELPSVQGFGAAALFVRPEDMKDLVGAGPGPENHLAVIRKCADAGFDHIVLVGVGPAQAGFIDFFERELRPGLDDFG